MAGQENYSLSHIINYKDITIDFWPYTSNIAMIIISFLKQCLSKSSVETSSFFISYLAPWSPPPLQALRHVERTQPPGRSGIGCSTPTTRLCHCLHSQGWAPLPQQEEGWCYLGNPVKAKANTPERCCSAGRPEAHGKTSHTLVSILLFPYLPTLRIPLFRILSYLSYCNYPAGQQQAPCPPLKNIAWYEQPLLEKEKEERWSQQHKDMDGMFSSVHI